MTSPFSYHRHPRGIAGVFLSCFLLLCTFRLERAQEPQSGTLNSTGTSLFASALPYLGFPPRGDDDELVVRASAVLKSQGRENWSRGRPGPVWARTNSRSFRDTSCEKSVEKSLVGWRHVKAPPVENFAWLPALPVGVDSAKLGAIIEWQPCCGSLGRGSLRDVTNQYIFG